MHSFNGRLGHEKMIDGSELLRQPVFVLLFLLHFLHYYRLVGNNTLDIPPVNTCPPENDKCKRQRQVTDRRKIDRQLEVIDAIDKPKGVEKCLAVLRFVTRHLDDQRLKQDGYGSIGEKQ